ncbi:MAG: hypothetical protein LKF47_07255 [Megasphaera sp.]|nr:hypothetical protein [Megasphaera sp.]
MKKRLLVTGSLKCVSWLFVIDTFKKSPLGVRDDFFSDRIGITLQRKLVCLAKIYVFDDDISCRFQGNMACIKLGKKAVGENAVVEERQLLEKGSCWFLVLNNQEPHFLTTNN